MKIIYVHCGEETNSGPEFFSGLISNTSSVVFMAARISYMRFFTAVHIYIYVIYRIRVGPYGEKL